MQDCCRQYHVVQVCVLCAQQEQDNQISPRVDGSAAHHAALSSLQGALQQLLAMRKYSEWVTSASGTLLVAGGTYMLLSRLLPQ